MANDSERILDAIRELQQAVFRLNDEISHISARVEFAIGELTVISLRTVSPGPGPHTGGGFPGPR
jgi:hypothetical protein